MYEMLTGRVPFDADTPVSVALKHMQEQPIEPIKINPLIPIALNKIITKAMQKDPNVRYQTATEMLRDLKQVSKNPDGNFVVLDKYPNDFPTQKINTVYEKKVNDTDRVPEERKNPKKQNKLVAFFNKHKVLKVFAIILVCIAIFALAMGITIAVSNANRPKQVQIPNLVGKTIEEVENLTKEANIKYEVIAEEFSADQEVGKVIKQDPKYAANYKVLENSTVKITISKGVELTKVPKVAGEKKDTAITMLENAGLKYEIKEENNDKIEAGVVIKQEPEQDEEVAKDSVVTIYVSLGTNKVPVPDVLGKTEAEAKKAIEDLKLKVSVKTGEDTTKSNGVVIKQDIDSGTQIEEGSTITITVNKLPEIINGTVNINVKELTGYQPPKVPANTTSNSTGGTSTAPKKVTVKVIIVSQGTSKEYIKENVSEDLEKLSVDISGIGTVKVSVYIDGNIKSDEQYWDLNVNNTINIP